MKQALDSAREAGVPSVARAEERGTTSCARWGHGVAYERSRVAPLAA